ncbi:MAG: hypothetical protein AB8I08_18105 [Sandaracinaceae bacterium]
MPAPPDLRQRSLDRAAPLSPLGVVVTSARAVVLMVLAAMVVLPATASAHGRPASMGRIVEDPLSPGRRVARATWGLARSDDGTNWRWGCAASYGVDARNEDPAIAYARGAIVLGTFEGLLRSTDEGCTWERPSELLTNVFVVEVVALTPDRLMAVGALTAQPDQLFESVDAGQTWTRLGAPFGDVVIERLLPAGDVLYASGSLADDGEGNRVPTLLRSEDGGLRFEATPVPIEEGERGLVVWATALDDADVIYAEMLHFNGEPAPERILRSEDAGATWETVLRLPYVGGLVVTPEGVFVGSRLGGLHHAEDGRSFETIDPDLAVTCLSDLSDGLFVCVDEAISGYALGRWNGADVDVLTRLSEIDEPMICAPCSDVGAVCPAWEPDIIVDLGLDAELPPDFDPDAATGAPRDAGLPSECRPESPSPGCGCRLAGSGPRATNAAVWLCGLLGLVCLRRRR